MHTIRWDHYKHAAPRGYRTKDFNGCSLKPLQPNAGQKIVRRFTPSPNTALKIPRIRDVRSCRQLSPVSLYWRMVTAGRNNDSTLRSFTPSFRDFAMPIPPDTSFLHNFQIIFEFNSPMEIKETALNVLKFLGCGGRCGNAFPPLRCRRGRSYGTSALGQQSSVVRCFETRIGEGMNGFLPLYMTDENIGHFICKYAYTISPGLIFIYSKV